MNRQGYGPAGDQLAAAADRDHAGLAQGAAPEDHG